MNRKTDLLKSLYLALLACMATAGQAQQTTTSAQVNFEILSVDGNQLVVRDQNGTHEYTAPADFRFQVDGRPLAVGDLKAGMKGTATVTTTTTIKPVYVTEIHKGEVLSRVSRTVVVRGDDGKTRRYTQSELDERGVRIYMDGKRIGVSDLNRGDLLSATFVTQAAPEILTQRQVEATLAAPDVVVPSVADSAAKPEASPAEPLQTAAASTPASAAVPIVSAPDVPASRASPSYGWLMWILILILIGVMVYLAMRNRKEEVS